MTHKPDPDPPADALPYEQSAKGTDRAASLAASTGLKQATRAQKSNYVNRYRGNV